MPLLTARPTRLVSRKGPKSSGKRETTSICMALLFRLRSFEPFEPPGSKHDLPGRGVDPIDEVVDERHFDGGPGSLGRRTERHHDDVGARVTDEVLDDADVAAGAHERRADDVAHVKLPLLEDREAIASDANGGA